MDVKRNGMHDAHSALTCAFSVFILNAKSMDTVTLTIDGKNVTSAGDRKLLWAALDAGIYIPHLCALEEMPLAHGGCRLCFVEIEGRSGPVTSCSVSVEHGMVVHTDTPAVRRLVKRSFELILSNHPLPCRGCHAHGACKLQDMARRLHLKLSHPRLEKAVRRYPLDDSHPDIIFDPSYCVLCGLCVYVCNEVEKAHAVNFELRGMDMKVGTFGGLPLAETTCTSCMRCTDVCPVGAFRRKAPSPEGERGESEKTS
jgi:formate dehydrogenase major subunit/NADH-quinone oxidoreductase subunit G